MKKMTISKAGIDFIKSFEGLSLEAYKCPAGVWTIGYGTTKNVTKGMKITKGQADDLFIEDVAPIERKLNSLGINFRQEQFDALVSWNFNLGEGAFRNSTLLKKIVADAPDEEITDQIVKWVNAGGKPLVGLKRRRVAEANMFLGYDKYYLDDKNNIKKR